MVNKDCGLRDHILQSLTMLDKKLESFIIIFSTLILIFKKNILHFYIPHGCSFPTIPNLLIYSKYLKSYSFSKN